MSPFEKARLLCMEKLVEALDRAASRRRSEAPHLAMGRRGERAAFFYLRRLGFVITARCWRTSKAKGDLDLIGWENEVLCFIEVKTRTTRAVAPAEAAVDADKKRAPQDGALLRPPIARPRSPRPLRHPLHLFRAGQARRLHALSRSLRLGIATGPSPMSARSGRGRSCGAAFPSQAGSRPIHKYGGQASGCFASTESSFGSRPRARTAHIR